ncbi:hypothetical protein HNR44_000800 [Geomicrobium halophilum]|uniref:YqfQ-like protein n=1 Tax=Geomicrobium halophilum TaxID=549000 RepID=A0A841PRE4_9BACL|nr:hypothetical protein [Geomicrobium halophilum]MBB6448851.1 hypothetical protein [Geomicrobium halophilum]
MMPMPMPVPPAVPSALGPMAARSAALPMMGGGLPSAAGGGAALAQGAPSLGSVGQLIPMLQNSAKWLPMIQKYGPMVKQIPPMLQKANQVRKMLKSPSASKPALPPAPASETKNEQEQKLESGSSEEVFSEKIKPMATFEMKEGEQPPPKLYV